jgi:hypothetical protein
LADNKMYSMTSEKMRKLCCNHGSNRNCVCGHRCRGNSARARLADCANFLRRRRPGANGPPQCWARKPAIAAVLPICCLWSFIRCRETNVTVRDARDHVTIRCSRCASTAGAAYSRGRLWGL